jgi:hypothetical protein
MLSGYGIFRDSIQCVRCYKTRGNMDPNRRTRIITTIGIVAILLGLIFVGYRMIGGASARVGEWFSGNDRTIVAEEADDERPEDAGRVELAYSQELDEFREVSAIGGWRIELSPGDFGVTVSVNERHADDITVLSRNGVVTLTMEPGLRSVANSIVARVTVPTLERLDLDGGADVRINDLDGERLLVEVDGAASVKAVGSDITQLSVDVDGAANIDFSESSVVNADVDMDGASNLSITMAGGRLSGVLSGVGNVSYGGEVTDESIRIEGLGRVRER